MGKIFIPIFALLFIAAGIYSGLGVVAAIARELERDQPASSPAKLRGVRFVFHCLGSIMLAGDSISKFVTLGF